jgi:hypothetical protein
MKLWVLTFGCLTSALLVCAQAPPEGGREAVDHTTADAAAGTVTSESGMSAAARGERTSMTVAPVAGHVAADSPRDGAAAESTQEGEKSSPPATEVSPAGGDKTGAAAGVSEKKPSLLRRLKQKVTPRRSQSAHEASDDEAAAEAPPAGTPSPEAPAAPPRSPAPSATVRAAANVGNSSVVQDGDYPVLEQTVAKYRGTPATVVRPTELCATLQASAVRIQSFYAAGNHEGIRKEAEFMRSQICGLRSLRSLGLEQRLKVTSICRMLDDGLQLVDEGQQSDDESKVQLGLEKLHEASELLESFGAE